MFRFLIVYFLIALFLCSCRTKKNRINPASIIHPSLPFKATKLTKEISNWLGAPYKLGGNTKNGVDCSGFIVEVFKIVYDKKLPRTSIKQFELSKKISISHVQEGDLIFFSLGTEKVSHVGIYLHENQFAHASVSKGVILSNLSTSYYKKYFVGVGRF